MQQLAFLMVTLISINSSAEIRPQDCELDQSKFCEGTKIDSDEFWNCLKKRKSELYSSCKIQIDHHEFHKICKDDIEAQCKDVQPMKGHKSAVHNCMIKARFSKKGVSKKCRIFMDKHPTYFNNSSKGFC